MTKACNDNNPRKAATLPAVPCPMCGEEARHKYRPFCSKKCADIDLGRWLNGRYVIHADPGGEEAESVPVGQEDRPDRMNLD